MIVGGGIAAIQSSLDLAESGYYVYLVEKSPAIGGVMPMLDKTFPTNDCSMCILSPKLVECGRHLNIEILTCSDVVDVQGEPGNFKVTVNKRARYVDVDKCTGCGLCAEECPVEIEDEFDQGLGIRKAIYRPYAQAFPNAFAIDMDECIECMMCEDACEADAIDHDMEDETVELDVGSIIMCPGFEKYDATALDYYGYGKYENVITSMEFERILSASGPFGGDLIRPSDKKQPDKIAWIQCVGSRNVREGLGYCSSVCCMYSIKEAVIAKEHSKKPLDTSIFFMDMRTYGKDFEKYYERAEEEQGVRFIRSRVIEFRELDDSKNISIRYADEDGTLKQEEFDMVVLSIGLKPQPDAVELGKKLGLELNCYNFCEPAPLSGVQSSRPGIYVAGAFSGPKDIPETVMQASAAAGDSAVLLSDVRGTKVQEKVYPAELDVYNEILRIGVFVCHCGINIGGVVNVPSVVEYVKTLPHVVYVEENMYSCSQDTQAKIKEVIKEHNLNRVVVASCTPRTHEPLFQETLREAGLNPHLFELANIRDQCSWVHMNEPELATSKSEDLIRMAVARAALLEPIQATSLDMTHETLVIGGGVSGMTSALQLAEQGYDVYLVEKSETLGGLASRIKTGFRGEDVATFVTDLVNKVTNHPHIKVYTNATVDNVVGFVGNFVTTLSTGEELKHGVAVIATGAYEYKPEEYLYGDNDNVLTQLEMELAIDENDKKVSDAKNIVMIQCVGSREPERPYCSRVCCNKTMKLALKLKENDPEKNIYVLYRDIRTYGFMEDAYREAREKGVIFVRYTAKDKPVVTDTGSGLNVVLKDLFLDVPLQIPADLIVLASAIVASKEENLQMSKFFKIPLNEDGFFLEAHMKLRPVDFSTDGVFMCGLAHGPKSIEENIAQAKAAAGRACTVLSKEFVTAEGKTSYVDKNKCMGCGDCEAVCPYDAITVDPVEMVAVVNEALCKGCGVCASSCRPGALNIKGFSNQQIMAMVSAL